MDESVKRRERLMAMRSEASSQGGEMPFHDFGNSSSPSPLVNPLLNPTPTQPMHEDSNPSSRFDYYTDPLSAYSGTKRTKHDSQMTFAPQRPSPMQQPPFSPDFRAPQVRRPFYPPQQQYGMSPYGGPPHQGIPRSWNAPQGSSYHHSPNNSPRANSFQPYPAQGRGPWHNHNPGTGSGHTGYRGNHQSSNLGRGHGRYGNFARPGGWTGSRNQSAEVEPGLYYDKSSVEDPWKFLSPVSWKGGRGSITVTSSVSRKPETPAKWSGAGAGPSLAEFLADSFSEAAAAPDNTETSKD